MNMKNSQSKKERRKQSALQTTVAKVTCASALIGLITAVIVAVCQLQRLFPG